MSTDMYKFTSQDTLAGFGTEKWNMMAGFIIEKKVNESHLRRIESFSRFNSTIGLLAETSFDGRLQRDRQLKIKQGMLKY